MAITQITVASPANEVIFTDTVMGNAADAIKASSALLYYVTADNSGNASPVYVKIYNIAAGSVTVGVSAPDEIILVPASSVITQQYITGSVPGKTFGTALSACCVTAGGTAGSTSPSVAVKVSLVYV